MANESSKSVESETPNGAVNLGTAMVMHDKALLKSLSICFPASILSYDRESHIAEVQPLVKQGRFDGEWKFDEVRKSYKVRVLAIQQGGFTIDVPLFRGDTGWVISSDRDTTLLKQEGAYTASVLEKDRSEEEVSAAYPQKPSTLVLHDLASGFFIPDNWGRFEVDRVKDTDTIDIPSGLYIGQSIDTNETDTQPVWSTSSEDAEDTDTEEEEGVAISPQTGDRYEKETSSSLVIERHGGIHILSSCPQEDSQKARLTVEEDKVESEIEDYANSIVLHSSTSLEDGMTISHMSEGNTFMFKYNEGQSTIEMIKEDGTKVIIRFANGKIEIVNSGNLHIRSLANSHVLVDAAATINSKSALVSADKMNIVTGENVILKSDSDIHLRGAPEVNLCAQENLNVIAGKDLDIQSHGAIHLFGREHCKIVSGEEIGIKSNQAIAMRSLNLDVGEALKAKWGRMEIALQGDLKMKGHGVSVDASDGKVDIGSNVEVQGWSKGSANGHSAWVWTPEED